MHSLIEGCCIDVSVVAQSNVQMIHRAIGTGDNTAFHFSSGRELDVALTDVHLIEVNTKRLREIGRYSGGGERGFIKEGL